MLSSHPLLPTEQQLLEYRAVTQILQLFDRAEARSDSEFHGINMQKDIARLATKRRHDVATFRILTALVNVLVRGVEIIAIIPSRGAELTIQLEPESDVLGVFQTEDVVITKNPDRAETAAVEATGVESLTIRSDPSRFRLNVNKVFLQSTDLPLLERDFDVPIWVQDPRRWMNIQRARRGKRIPGKRIHFSEHLKIVLAMLSQFHRSSNETERNFLWHRAQQYVCTEDVFKMQRRLNNGKATVTRAKKLPGKGKAKDQPPVVEGKNLYDFIVAGPLPSHAPISRSALNAIPLSKQARQCLEELRCLESEPEEPLYWFDEAGRRRLGVALGTALLQIERSVDHACQASKQLEAAIAPSYNDRWEANLDLANITQQAAKDVIDSLAALDALLDAYRFEDPMLGSHDLVERYFRWVADCYDIETSLAAVCRPIEAAEPSAEGAPVEEDENDEADDELSTSSAEEQHLPPQERWAKTARRYLDTVLLQWKSLQTLFYPGDRLGVHMQHFLKNFKVNLIEAKCREEDTRSSNLLATILSHPHATQRTNAKAVLLDWLKHLGISNEFLNPRPFGGTYHCEALLLSLHLFKQTCESDISLMKFLETNDHQISVDFLKSLGDLSAAIAVSKKCCPSCGSLVEAVNQTRALEREKTSSKGLSKADILRKYSSFIYAGTHSNWSAVALPSFLPKPYFDFALQKAREALGDYLGCYSSRYPC